MASPLILALETSGPRGSLALAAGADVVAFRELGADRAYSSALFPALDAILRDAGKTLPDVTVFAFSAGPGSFTGLRVAATVARMLHSACACRVLAVPTLEVIAVQAAATGVAPPTRIVALLDAKHGHAYSAAFEPIAPAELREIEAAAVRTPASWLPTLAGPLAITGPGVRAERAACDAACASGRGVIVAETAWQPRADTVAVRGARRVAAGHVSLPAEIVPLYARPPECEEVYEQRRAAARARRGA